MAPTQNYAEVGVNVTLFCVWPVFSFTAIVRRRALAYSTLGGTSDYYCYRQQQNLNTLFAQYRYEKKDRQ